jgi:hypothetical protein
MATVNDRTSFKDYCLRRLGFPVIEINVDPEQIEDRINDAIQYWTDYHFDSLQKFYYIHRLTAEDTQNRYLKMSPADVVDSSNNQIQVVGVTKVFPIQDSQATINMFDLRYQLRLNELYDFTSASYINYTMTQQHLRSLELLFTGEIPIRFQRHMNRLYIDWNWGTSAAPEGSVVVAECYAALNPDTYPDVWNDRWLKEYATALIKRTWGNNLKKFSGMQLPGGVQLNGDKIYEEAETEIKALEAEMETKYGGVLEFYLN